MVKFTVSPIKKHNDLQFVIVEFSIEGGVIEPAELKEIVPPQVPPKCGVVLSGRGPIWLFCFLAHHFHPAAFIGSFDPRLGAAVITESHVKGIAPGDLIPV